EPALQENPVRPSGPRPAPALPVVPVPPVPPVVSVASALPVPPVASVASALSVSSVPSVVIAVAMLALATHPVEAQRTQRQASNHYVPGPTWEHRTPTQAGLDSAKLAAAIAFAISKENP